MTFTAQICSKIRPNEVEVLNEAISILVPNPLLGGVMRLKTICGFDESLNLFYPVRFNLKEAIDFIKWSISESKLSVRIGKENAKLQPGNKYYQEQLNNAEDCLKKEIELLEKLKLEKNV